MLRPQCVWASAGPRRSPRWQVGDGRIPIHPKRGAFGRAGAARGRSALALIRTPFTTWRAGGFRTTAESSSSAPKPGHRLRYYVQESIHSPPKPISGEDILFDRNGDDIVISPDGRFVAVELQDETVNLMPVDGGVRKTIPGLDTGLTPVAFCRDNSLLVYRSGEIPARIVRVNLQTGQKTPWRELAPVDHTGIWTIQPIRVAADCVTYAAHSFGISLPRSLWSPACIDRNLTGGQRRNP